MDAIGDLKLKSDTLPVAVNSTGNHKLLQSSRYIYIRP